MADTFGSGPFPDWLVARGLGPSQTEVVAETPPIGEPSLPYDYEARVKALEMSINVHDWGHSSEDRPRVLERALDFLAFLTAQSPKEEGKEDV